MAVYTQVSREQVDAFWQGFDLPGVQELIGIAEGTENSNYKVVTADKSYILTLFEKRTDPRELPFFASLMQHLAGRGVSCPLPVASRQGALLGELCGRPAVVTSFLQGASLKSWQPAHCHALGKALAGMHNAAEGFKGERANRLSVAGWRELFAGCAQADDVRPGLHAQLAQELEVLQAQWPTDLPRGVIHADLFPDNVFFTGEGVSGLIDFYFACSDFFAYDIAICLNAWCFEDHVSFNITKAQQLLRGYVSVRPLSQPERAALPILCRGAALRFLLTRLYDWLHPKGGKPRDPLDYFKRLSFHQQVQGITAYGLAA